MRTITTVTICFVLLIVLSLGSYRLIESTSNTLSTQLEKVENSINQQKWERAKQEMNLTQATWDKTKNWWTILLDHQEIDNIDVSINRLGKYVDLRRNALSLGEVSALKLYVGHIADTEVFNLKNIL